MYVITSIDLDFCNCFINGHNFYIMLQSYVVYMGAQSHLFDASLQELDSVTNSHLDLLASFVGRYKIW